MRLNLSRMCLERFAGVIHVVSLHVDDKRKCDSPVPVDTDFGLTQSAQLGWLKTSTLCETTALALPKPVNEQIQTIKDSF